MSAICSACGGKTDIDGAVFCGHCGARLPRQVSPPMYTPPSAPATPEAPKARDDEAQPLPLSRRTQPNLKSTTYVYVAERPPSSKRTPPPIAATPAPSSAATVQAPRFSELGATKVQLGPIVPKRVESPAARPPLPSDGQPASAPASMLEAFARVSGASSPPAAPVSEGAPAASSASAPPVLSPTMPATKTVSAASAPALAPSAPKVAALPAQPAPAAAQPSSGTGWTPVPPSPPASKPDASSPSQPADSVSSVIGDVLDAIDAGFDGLMDGTSTMRVEAPTASDMQAVQQLFTNIAATHMRPVRDFMIELGIGEPPKEWVDVVAPAVASLRRSAEGMGLSELCAEIDGYEAVLDEVGESQSSTITDEQKKQLLAAYDRLASAMPEAFRLDEERDRREPIIVQTLLRQVPEVRKVALDKLYAAGLTSLEMYYVAKPYDIAHAAGLPHALAERIVERFARYREEISRSAPDAVRSGELVQLEDLAERLAAQTDEYEAASRSASKDAASVKRRLRGERTETVLEMNLVLARIGAVDLVKQLEKLAFHAKVEAVRKYIEAASQEAAGSTRGKQGSV